MVLAIMSASSTAFGQQVKLYTDTDAPAQFAESLPVKFNSAAEAEAAGYRAARFSLFSAWCPLDP